MGKTEGPQTGPGLREPIADSPAPRRARHGLPAGRGLCPHRPSSAPAPAARPLSCRLAVPWLQVLEAPHTCRLPLFSRAVRSPWAPAQLAPRLLGAYCAPSGGSGAAGSTRHDPGAESSGSLLHPHARADGQDPGRAPREAPPCLLQLLGDPGVLRLVAPALQSLPRGSRGRLLQVCLPPPPRRTPVTRSRAHPGALIAPAKTLFAHETSLTGTGAQDLRCLLGDTAQTTTSVYPAAVLGPPGAGRRRLRG